MKLTFYQLYYHLKKKYNVRRISFNPDKIEVGRPVYYKSGKDCAGHTVLIENHALMEINPLSSLWNRCIFICFGEVYDIFCRMDTDLLVLDKKTDREMLMNDLQEIFEFFEDFESSVLDVFLENKSFKALIGCFEKVFDTPLSLSDSNFFYVAYSADESFMSFVNESNALPMHMVSQLISDPSYKQSITLRNVYTYTLEQTTLLCKNLFYEGEFIGKLITLSDVSPLTNEYHKDMLITCGRYVEKMYERYESFHISDNALDSMHEMLKIRLKGGKCQDEKWKNALRSVSWSETDTFCIIQMRPNHRYDKTLYDKYLCPEMEAQWKGTCCVVHDSSLVMLLNTTVMPLSEFQPELAYFLRENLLAAGISRNFEDFNNIYTACRQTDIAFEVGCRKDPYFWYFRFHDYALDYLLMRGKGEFTFEQICSPALIILKQHDEKMNTEYYRTLYYYVQFRYNAALAAKKLFIHRSTFLNRMERIEELTHLDLDSFRERLYLSLSFYILETDSLLDD